jgi:hypothetical protein
LKLGRQFAMLGARVQDEPKTPFITCTLHFFEKLKI